MATVEFATREHTVALVFEIAISLGEVLRLEGDAVAVGAFRRCLVRDQLRLDHPRRRRSGRRTGRDLADRIIAIQMKNMAPNGTTTEDGWAATGDDIIDWGKIRTTPPRDKG
ncbi:hypothetical protein ACOJBM_04540 [Rhizobium beringeri]